MKDKKETGLNINPLQILFPNNLFKDFFAKQESGKQVVEISFFKKSSSDLIKLEKKVNLFKCE